VAKDLTKTASKSAIKATAGEASGQLFKWVAFFTGSKNAMKGIGFFMGGVLLEVLGFRVSLWVMAALLSLVLLGVVTYVPKLMGKSKASKSAKELFAKNKAINLLAAARVVLFGARDVCCRGCAGVFVCRRLVQTHGGRFLGSVDYRVWNGASLRASPG
jgi:hypothetical protein